MVFFVDRTLVASSSYIVASLCGAFCLEVFRLRLRFACHRHSASFSHSSVRWSSRSARVEYAGVIRFTHLKNSDAGCTGRHFSSRILGHKQLHSSDAVSISGQVVPTSTA